PQTRKVIEASPLDPAADLAGALRGFPDRGALRVVARAEIPQHFQKFALILRLTSPRHAPLRVSTHPSSPSSTLPLLLTFMTTPAASALQRSYCSAAKRFSRTKFLPST